MRPWRIACNAWWAAVAIVAAERRISKPTAFGHWPSKSRPRMLELRIGTGRTLAGATGSSTA
jgi:hypothetical protein